MPIHPGDARNERSASGRLKTLQTRFAAWAPTLLSFAIGQPVVQALNLITGFLLIRWLSVEQYAMLGMAIAFQTVVAQLTDIGFTSSIIALSGTRGRDPEILGGYLRSARFWRVRFQTCVLLLAAIAFPLVTWSQPWGAATKGLLFATITLGVVLQGWSMYGSPLLAHRVLHLFYRPQMLAAISRLAACAVLHLTGLLTAWVAAFLAALALGYAGLSYRRSARPYAREPARADPALNAEMLRYLSPLIPGLVFSILQSQILIGISAIFGSTRNVAEISALGRIGHLFIVLGTFTTVVVEPYIARLDRSMLPRRYLQIVGVGSALALVIGFTGYVLPAPFLWLLGANYAGLETEVAWVLVTACINYVGSIMWGIHLARKWVFWWGTLLYITAMLITQSACIASMDLTQTMSVIWFGLITSSVVLLIHIATAAYGFAFGPAPKTLQP